MSRFSFEWINIYIKFHFVQLPESCTGKISQTLFKPNERKEKLFYSRADKSNITCLVFLDWAIRSHHPSSNHEHFENETKNYPLQLYLWWWLVEYYLILLLEYHGTQYFSSEKCNVLFTSSIVWVNSGWISDSFNFSYQ